MQELGRNDGSVYVYFFGASVDTDPPFPTWTHGANHSRPRCPARWRSCSPIRPAHRPVIRWHGGAVRRMLLCGSWREGKSPVKAAPDLGAKNFSLISLDGFRPSPELSSLPGTTLACRMQWGSIAELRRSELLQALPRLQSEGNRTMAAPLCFGQFARLG